MKVLIYWDLHRKIWSAKALEGERKGRVIAKPRQVVLSDAVAKVSEAGRQRVLREERKNVHAGIVGELVTLDADVDGFLQSHLALRGITYNPYKGPGFVYRDSGADYTGSPYAYFDADGRAYAVA